MSNISQFMGGGGGGTSPNYKLFLTSETFITPYNATYKIWALGGGGGGGSGVYATGGGGGGFCLSEVYLPAGTSLTVTIGAGGARGGGGDTTANGTAGGNTVISGTGMTTMTAGGGGAGQSGANGSATKAGGTGGTATGGTLVNNAGGAGGEITITNGSSIRVSTGGGGAGSIRGVGGRGGNVTTTTPAGIIATGGGGVLGNGGDVTNGSSQVTGGGTPFANAAANSASAVAGLHGTTYEGDEGHSCDWTALVGSYPINNLSQVNQNLIGITNTQGLYVSNTANPSGLFNILITRPNPILSFTGASKSGGSLTVTRARLAPGAGAFGSITASSSYASVAAGTCGGAGGCVLAGATMYQWGAGLGGGGGAYSSSSTSITISSVGGDIQGRTAALSGGAQGCVFIEW